MNSKKKLQSRRRYTMEKKLLVLKEYEAGTVYERSEILAKHQVPYELVNRWRKCKDKLIDNEPFNTVCTKGGNPWFDDLDSFLFNFCLDSRTNFKFISLPQLIEYAESYEHTAFNSFTDKQKRNYLFRFLEKHHIGKKHYPETNVSKRKRTKLTPDSNFDIQGYIKNIESITKGKDKSSLIAMEYISIRLDFPPEVVVSVNGYKKIVELNSTESFRFGLILGGSLDGSKLESYVIFPNSESSRFSKKPTDSSSTECYGLQENGFIDPQQAYNWIQTVFRPVVYPRHKVHNLLISDFYEESFNLCQRQLDKCQTKCLVVPNKAILGLHPLHQSILDKVRRKFQAIWLSWLSAKVTELCETHNLESFNSSFYSCPSIISSTDEQTSESNSPNEILFTPTSSVGSPLEILQSDNKDNITLTCPQSFEDEESADDMNSKPVSIRKENTLTIPKWKVSFYETEDRFQITPPSHYAVVNDIISPLLPRKTVLEWTEQISSELLSPENIKSGFFKCFGL